MNPEELDKLERERDEEIAALAARIGQIGTVAQARKSIFEREEEQLRELFLRSTDQFEASLRISESRLSGQIEESGVELEQYEKRLKEILSETDPALMEKKLKSIEESVARESRSSPNSMLEAMVRELQGVYRGVEERVSQKSAQILRLKEDLALKERDLAKMTERLENERVAILAAGRKGLEKKERVTADAINRLNSELARRNLRLNEVAKIVEARELWLSQEKTRRLDGLKVLIHEVEARGADFKDKCLEEKIFWEAELKRLDSEIGALNIKSVTAQVELGAFKTRIEEEKKKALAQLEVELAQREAAFQAKAAEAREKLVLANGEIARRVKDLAEAQDSQRRALKILEEEFQRREIEATAKIKDRREALESERSQSMAMLEAKARELERLRQEYDSNMLTPVLEAKKKHLEELEAEQLRSQAKIEDDERRYAALLEELDGRIAEAQRETASLGSKLEAEGRAYKQQVQDLEREKGEVLDPYAGMLGELEKAMELARAKFQEDAAALEERKAGLSNEAKRRRAAFETGVEERRKELLFIIENLKAQAGAQQTRQAREEEERRRTLESARLGTEQLHAELARRKAEHEADYARMDAEIEEARLGNEEKIQALNAELARRTSQWDEDLRSRQGEIAKIEADYAGELERQKQRWEGEQAAIERRRNELLGAINERTEAFAALRSRIETETNDLETKLLANQDALEVEDQRWQGVLEQLEERRRLQIAPLEERCHELERGLREHEASFKKRLDMWQAQIDALHADLSGKHQLYAQERASRQIELAAHVRELEGKLTEMQAEHRRATEPLQSQCLQRERDLEVKQQALLEMRSGFDIRSRRAQEEFEQEHEQYRLEAERLQKELKDLQERADVHETAKKQEMEGLSGRLDALDSEHAAELAALEDRMRRDQAGLEEEMARVERAREAELAVLTEKRERLDQAVKAGLLEAEALRSQAEVEAVEMERQRRRFEAETRVKRAELAQDLRSARRQEAERLKEADHEAYVANMKVELRSRRLQEIIEKKRQALVGIHSQWQDRARGITSQIQAQREEFETTLAQRKKKIEALESEKQEWRGRIEELARSGEPSQDVSIEHARARGRRQIEIFRERLGQLLAAKKADKAKMLEAAKIMEPLGRDLSLSLTDFILLWEREVRRMEAFLKTLEDSPLITREAGEGRRET